MYLIGLGGQPCSGWKVSKGESTADTIEEQKGISTSDQEVSGTVWFYFLSLNGLIGVPVIIKMLYIVASVLVSNSLLR
jgi:hypothetical protein